MYVYHKQTQGQASTPIQTNYRPKEAFICYWAVLLSTNGPETIIRNWLEPLMHSLQAHAV